MKDKEHKKRTLWSLTLPFFEQLQIHLRDLLQYILRLSERTQSSTSFFISLGTGIWRTWRLPRLMERIQIGPWPLPLRFSQNRQPGLLQRTMRLNKEPGKMVERSGICCRSCLREAVSWATLSFISYI